MDLSDTGRPSLRYQGGTPVQQRKQAKAENGEDFGTLDEFCTVTSKNISQATQRKSAETPVT